MIGSDEHQLKVLLLSTSFPLTPNSSSGLFVKYLHQALGQKCCLQTLVPDDCFTDSSELPPSVSVFRYAPKSWQRLAHLPGGIPSQLKTNRWAFFLIPIFLLSYALSTFVLARKVDLIHANWAVSGFIAGLLKPFGSFKLVTTLRGEDVKDNLGFSNKFFLKRALVKSDAVVLVSQDMKGLLETMFPQFSHKYHVIHNGVSSEFHVTRTSSISTQEAVVKIAFVGSLIERKNVGMLLRALSMVNSSSVRCELSIIGEGEASEALKILGETLELSGQLCFLGALNHESLVDVLAKSDIYISASVHEGRPNSVLEAMAAGCCLVLSDINGHRELVGLSEGGRLFDVLDDESLAFEISELLNNPQRI